MSAIARLLNMAAGFRFLRAGGAVLAALLAVASAPAWGQTANSIDAVAVHPREVFSPAIRDGAAAVVV